MRNYFCVIGHAFNQYGLPVGIKYQIAASDARHASLHAIASAQQEGFIQVRISYVRQEVAA